MNKAGSPPQGGVQHEAQNLVALLTAISTVSKRMARKIALLEKRIAERKEESHVG